MNTAKLIRRFNRFRRNYFMDRRYGAFIGGVKKTPYPHLGAENTANIAYEELPPVFQGVVRPKEVLVDVGCGKGRVLNWWLDNFPGHRMYGIELDDDIAAATEARLRKYPVSVEVGDIRLLAPVDGTLYFLFNPFNAQVMAGFLETLKKRAASLPEDLPSPIQVLYYNCLHLHVFEADPDCQVTMIPMPPRFHRAALIKVG
ncbi:class I SAM-dependent methyltransferase [Nonomuraea sp. NPDC050536]|uniref:class I SAM-dependent methyltransferase n=1 Tax=Nonomuraea sp. NPDC050536 TaxID=3364366 RepID=UPI0037CAF41C